MKMETCSVLIMGGLLMGVEPVLRSLRPCLKVPKLALFGLLEHVPLGSLRWYLRACSLFGLMKMVGRKLMPPSLHCCLMILKNQCATVNIQRDLFYGYDTLMENVSDPSHIDFAHHKVTGRRDRAKPLTFKMDSRGPWGFAGANDGNPKISAKFVAPCYSMNKMEIDTKLPIVGDQKWVIWICSFNVPMAPGGS